MWLVSQTEPGKKSMGLDTGLAGSPGGMLTAKTDSKLTLPCCDLSPLIQNTTK